MTRGHGQKEENSPGREKMNVITEVWIIAYDEKPISAKRIVSEQMRRNPIVKREVLYSIRSLQVCPITTCSSSHGGILLYDGVVVALDPNS